MSRLTVNSTLKVMIAVFGIGTVAQLSIDAWSSWRRLEATRSISTVASASSDMFTALHNLRGDRADTVLLMGGDQVLSALSPRILARRGAEMPALRQALTALAALDFPDKTTVMADFNRRVTRLSELQAETAAAIQKPKAERRNGLGAEFQSEASALIDLLTGLSAKLAETVRLRDPLVDRLLDIKAHAWGARSSGGDASLVIIQALGGMQLPPETQQRTQINIGRAEAYFQALQDAAKGLDLPPQFAEAVAAAKREYFAPEFLALQNKYIKATLAGEKVDINGEQWTAAVLPKLETVLNIAVAALTHAHDYADEQTAAAWKTLATQISIVIAALVFAAAMMLLVSRRVTGPLVVMQDRMTQLAQGNLAVEVPYTDRGDEIGGLGKAMETFKLTMLEAERLRGSQTELDRRAAEERREAMHALADQFDRAIGSVVDMVASAATELQSSAQTLTASAEQTSSQSASVAAASEEASGNVASVASATEELSSSVSEISRQVAQSAAIASRAVTEAQQTNEQVRGLASAADRIGSIVGLINEIAGRTNLLALNATIEAARAGDAGKGFAVVAAEVKQLADQTAKATAEISTQIAAIQDATSGAAQAIEGIGRTIETMNTIAASISLAVDGQGEATGEIARNVQEASRGTSMVSASISGVTSAASESSTASGQVLSAASELSHQAEVLRGEVSKFLSTVRAA